MIALLLFAILENCVQHARIVKAVQRRRAVVIAERAA